MKFFLLLSLFLFDVLGEISLQTSFEDQFPVLTFGVSDEIRVGHSAFASNDSSTKSLTLEGYPSWMEVSLDEPKQVSQFLTTDASDLFMLGNLMFVGDGDEGLKILEILPDLTHFSLLGSIESSFTVTEIFVYDELAFLAGGGIEIANVSNPNSPIVFETFDESMEAKSVFVVDNYGYLTDWADGNYRFHILDVSDRENIDVVGTIFLYSYKCWIVADFAYVTSLGSGLQIFNVSDRYLPTADIVIGQIETSEALDIFLLPSTYPDTVFLADGVEGLVIVSILEGDSPTLISKLGIGGTRCVFVSSNFAFLCGIVENNPLLFIVDITDLSNPYLASYAVLDSLAMSIIVSGNYIYVANKDQGLTVFEFGDVLLSWEVTSVSMICEEDTSHTVTVSSFDASSPSIVVQDTFEIVIDNICAGNSTDGDCTNSTCDCLSSKYEGEECQYCSHYFYGDECLEYKCLDVSYETTKCDEIGSSGACDDDETQCLCRDGYAGLLCDRWECDSVSMDSELVCSEHGTCEYPDVCVCEAGYDDETGDSNLFCSVKNKGGNVGLAVGLTLGLLFVAFVVFWVSGCCCCFGCVPMAIFGVFIYKYREDVWESFGKESVGAMEKKKEEELVGEEMEEEGEEEEFEPQLKFPRLDNMIEIICGSPATSTPATSKNTSRIFDRPSGDINSHEDEEVEEHESDFVNGDEDNSEET